MENMFGLKFCLDGSLVFCLVGPYAGQVREKASYAGSILDMYCLAKKALQKANINEIEMYLVVRLQTRYVKGEETLKHTGRMSSSLGILYI